MLKSIGSQMCTSSLPEIPSLHALADDSEAHH